MSVQKFSRGDKVLIAKYLGPSMEHFATGGCEAIVKGSYADQYGGDNIKSYSLHIVGQGPSSWYDEDQLTLVESGGGDPFKRALAAAQD